MILSTILTAITLSASPAPINEQATFLLPGKKIRISATSPSRIAGKKIRINGDMSGLNVLRAGKKIRIDASVTDVEVIRFGKKIRI